MGQGIVKINISRSLGTQKPFCVTDNSLIALEKFFPQSKLEAEIL